MKAEGSRRPHTTSAR